MKPHPQLKMHAAAALVASLLAGSAAAQTALNPENCAELGNAASRATAAACTANMGCVFSLNLHKTCTERRAFLDKLGAVLGGRREATNADVYQARLPELQPNETLRRYVALVDDLVQRGTQAGPIGKQEMRRANGVAWAYYEGQMKDGQPMGAGILLTDTGGVLRGMVQGSSLNGLAQVIAANQSMRVGEFRDSTPAGPLVVQQDNQAVWAGNWVTDKFVGPVDITPPGKATLRLRTLATGGAEADPGRTEPAIPLPPVVVAQAPPAPASNAAPAQPPGVTAYRDMTADQFQFAMACLNRQNALTAEGMDAVAKNDHELEYRLLLQEKALWDGPCAQTEAGPQFREISAQNLRTWDKQLAERRKLEMASQQYLAELRAKESREISQALAALVGVVAQAAQRTSPTTAPAGTASVASSAPTSPGGPSMSASSGNPGSAASSKRSNVPEAHASNCLSPQKEGGVINRCAFAIEYSYCVVSPKAGSWSASFDCLQNKWGSWQVGPNTRAVMHTAGAQVAFFGCRYGPSLSRPDGISPADVRFNPNGPPTGRCKEWGAP